MVEEEGVKATGKRGGEERRGKRDEEEEVRKRAGLEVVGVRR